MELDYGEITIKILITAGIMQFLRKYLETPVRLPEWDKYLKYTWAASLALLWFANALSLKFVDNLYYYLLLSFVIYIIYQSKDYRSARTLMVAITPLFIVAILNQFFRFLTPEFHKSYAALFETAKGFAITWMIGFGIYAQRQNKQEKLQRQKDEAERKILEAKKNELEYQVAERTAEITQQKEALEKAFVQLKATQNQLIQSEKLASLGELTAGIAHEIQNPLNFVNNFSELSVELAKELKEEIEKPQIDKELIMDLVNDLTQNQEKINHHGKRASSIVTGMLQHSQASTGERAMTDINKLADESLRLSYHGLRAKDKNSSTLRFNSKMETNFDENLPKIEVIPQDLGRVLINLINNAFYAVSKKHGDVGGEVIVSTKKMEKFIEISVKDNGTGMSEAVKTKIFQPFFTTKPTGEGTGLGLSLSYDIITKGHGGTLEVESKEGEGSDFIIKLPIGKS